MAAAIRTTSCNEIQNGYGMLKFGGFYLVIDTPGDRSLFGTVIDSDGNYVQIIQLSDEHRAAMEDQ